jgi:hypothetical protein
MNVMHPNPRHTLLLACLLLFGAAGILVWAGPSAAIAQTATATSTRRFTPTPTPVRFYIEKDISQSHNIDMRLIGLGSIAVDVDDQLYIGDGDRTVYVFTPQLQVVRSFQTVQPYALAFNPQGDLLIGQRNQAEINVFDRQGNFLRALWRQDSALLNAFGVAPDGSLYISWTSIQPPGETYLSRVGPNGEAVFTNIFGRPVRIPGISQANVVHGISVNKDGTLDITFTGFGATDDDVLSAYRRYTAQGELIRGRPLLSAVNLYAPAVTARIADGGLVMLSGEWVQWWAADNRVITRLPMSVLRDRWVPFLTIERRVAIAIRAGQRSAYFAEIRLDGTLQIGIINFVDTLSQ